MPMCRKHGQKGAEKYPTGRTMHFFRKSLKLRFKQLHPRSLYKEHFDVITEKI